MRIIRLAPAAAAFALAIGCAGAAKPILVKGKLSDGGKPVSASKQDGLTMVFLPVPPTGMTHPAGYNSEDMSFAVYGPAQKGIPAGKYKVTISIMSSKPSPANDKVNEQYGGDNTPIEVEIGGGEALDIDLAKFKKK